MSLESLPVEILLDLPQHLHDLEDLYSLFSTSRILYRAVGNPSPRAVPRLAAKSGRVFFRPHPHVLIAAMARSLADWAVESDINRHLLEFAIQGGVDKVLELATKVAEFSMQDVRRLHVYKNDVLNPLNRQLDLSAGPSSTQIDAWTVCNDPETTLLSWATYGELFHHTLELAYLPFPQHKPLSTIIRYKWFVYCMPDINSFTAFNFTQDETPQFSGETDMCHQLSMQCANRDFFRVSFRKALKTSASCQATSDEKIRRLFVDCAMHMGLRSLELLIPGGVEKLSEDLERIMRGIHRRRIENDELGGDSVAEKQLLKIIGDPWLLSTHITLELDLPFTFGGAGYYGLDDEEYDEVLEAEVIAAVHEPVRRPIADEAV